MSNDGDSERSRTCYAEFSIDSTEEDSATPEIDGELLLTCSFSRQNILRRPSGMQPRLQLSSIV